MLAVGAQRGSATFITVGIIPPVCYAIRRIESLRRRDTAVDALLVKLSELCQQDMCEQPAPLTSVFKKAVRHQRDDALIEELVDRIADRVVSKLQLGTCKPSSSLQEQQS
jgi:hypothetical protein